MGPGGVTRRTGSAAGASHGEYPEYLGIYRPWAAFLENSHALSSFDRRPYANRFTLRGVRLTRGYKEWRFGNSHGAENRHDAN